MTARPPRVFMRTRKPWVRLRLTTDGWNVRLVAMMRAFERGRFVVRVQSRSGSHGSGGTGMVADERNLEFSRSAALFVKRSWLRRR